MTVRSAVHPCPDCGAELWIRFERDVRIYDLASEYLHVCPTPHKKPVRTAGTCGCGQVVYQGGDGGLENADGTPHEHPAPAPLKRGIAGLLRGVLGAYDR